MSPILRSTKRPLARRLASALALAGVLSAPLALANPWRNLKDPVLDKSISNLLEVQGSPCGVGTGSVFLGSSREPKPVQRFVYCAPGCGSCDHQVDFITRNGVVIGRRTVDRAQE